MDKRWKAGLFDRVVYELYHTPADRKELAKGWRERILDKLPELSPKSYCITIPLLRMGGGVKLEQAAFPFALEQIHVDDYKDKEALERSFRRNEECKVYKAAGAVLRDLFYEDINPEDIRFPRPYRLEMSGNARADLGMYRTSPADGILLHPLIALAIRQESGGRLLPTAWDWGRKLKQLKKLQLVLSEKTVQSWDDEKRRAYLRAPEEHFPPKPYYSDNAGKTPLPGNRNADGRSLFNMALIFKLL